MIKGVLKTRGLHAIVWQTSVWNVAFCWWQAALWADDIYSFLMIFGFEILRVTVSVKILAPETREASFVAFFAHDIVLISALHPRAFRGHVNQCRILFLGVDGWWQRMDMCTVIFHCCHVRCLDDPYEEVRHLLTRICTGQNYGSTAAFPEPLGSRMNGVEICWQLKKGKQTTQTTLNFKNLAMCARFSFGKCGRVLHTSFCDSHSVMFRADARCVVPLLACLFSLGKVHGWTVLSDSRLICPEPNDLDDFSQLLKPLTRSGGISVAFLNDIVSHWNRPYQIRFQGPLLISFLAYPMSHPSHRSWNRELTFPPHLPERRVPTTARRICKI